MPFLRLKGKKNELMTEQNNDPDIKNYCDQYCDSSACKYPSIKIAPFALLTFSSFEDGDLQ